MASGWAIGRREPSLAILHTTAGLGNAVSALATARVNRAPLVVLVGQQDRRHLAQEPFLAGRLQGLAGEYPVWVDQPVRPQDVPGAVARAYHEAITGSGPALVIVPMDDWAAEAGEPHEEAAPARVVRAAAADPAAVAELAELIERSERPALVVGAGADDPETWSALVALAERLDCAVLQESFGARAGFPQDHPLFAGFLPADRARLRALLSPYDLVLAVGAPAFRQYGYETGPLVEAGHARSRWSAATPPRCTAVRPTSPCSHRRRPSAPGWRTTVRRRDGASAEPFAPPAPPPPPAPGERCGPGMSSTRSPSGCRATAVVIEESPSNRQELNQRLPARESLGTLSAAMGGLGFALPGRRRHAHGAARPARRRDRRRRLVAVLDPGALERRAIPRRRALRDPLERRLRDHGSPGRAPRRQRPVARLRNRRGGPRTSVRLPGPRA